MIIKKDIRVMIYHRIQIIIILLVLNSISIFGQLDGFHSNIKDNCKYCHIIEGENFNSQKVLWLNSNQNNNFIPYKSSTLDADVSIPMGSSKLCLSCHDGTLSSGHLNYQNLSASQIISTNLSSSHPVSFQYDSYLAYKDNGLHDPTSAPSGLGGTIKSDLLINGKLECISCHDVHNERAQKNLLIMSNIKSRLCLTCHNK